MYYKVEKGCKLFEDLMQLKAKAEQCNKSANAFAKKFNCEKFRPARGVLWGGISSFVLDFKPDGWKNSYTGEKNEYFPSKRNKNVYNEVKSLPVIENNELNNLIGYNIFSDKISNKILFHPAIKFNKNNVVIGFTDYVKYKPIKGMIEILFSEYKRLAL